MALSVQPAVADDISTTIDNFRSAGADDFIENSYGYAVFPSIGKGGIGIGGAHGKGEVFVSGKRVGQTKMNQITYGLQLGGQVYSQMIFFRDKRAFEDFASGNFEFGAQATAVALTAGAQASTSTGGGGTRQRAQMLIRARSMPMSGNMMVAAGWRCSRLPKAV